ncbi:MAG: multidrug efflux system outer membrane protein [Hyphomicrobiaceae bacterium]|jgi:multidrug efflux system outer membrane protein
MTQTSRFGRLAATLTVILVSVAGCSTGRPATSLAPELPSGWSAEHGVFTDPVKDVWWTTFADPNLDLLVAEALVSNRNLKAASERLEAAAAQARIAGAALVPALSASGSGARAKRNFIGFPDFSGAGDPAATPRVLSVTNSSFGVSLDLSWEIDLWGRVRAGRRAAFQDATAVAADLAAARHSIAGQTAKAWFAAIEASHQLELAEETAANFAETADRVWARYIKGLRTALDWRSAESARFGAQAAVASRRNVRDAAVRGLELLLGRYPAGTLAVTSSLPGVPPDPPVGLPSQLLARRADVAAAQSRLSAMFSRSQQARAALLPSFSLTGSVGGSSEELSDLLDGNFGVWQIAGGLVQPIFQGGRLRAAVDLADARRAEAAALYADMVLLAAADVEQALFQERTLADRQRTLDLAAVHSRAAAVLAEDRYFAGLEEYATLLASQRTAADASSRALAARWGRLDGRVNLHLALGGGFAELGDVKSPVAAPSRGADALSETTAATTPSEETQ